MIRPQAWFEDYWRKYDRNPYKPNPEAKKLARAWAKRVGFPPIVETPVVSVDPAVSRAIAVAYHKAKSNPKDPLVQRAYNALVREVRLQWKLLPLTLSYYGDNDAPPYTDSKEMMDDVLENRHLWVYKGGQAIHKLLPMRDNIKFRAIHDYFGHAAGGFSFGPNGEENAWVEHSKMFSPWARLAMTTETRGQNSWFNFGPHSKLPPDKRPFAVQKAIILPRPFLVHPVFVDAYKDYPGFILP